MPLVLDISTAEQTRIGIWRVEEPIPFFLNGLDLSQAEHILLSALNPVKQLEWLASRYVLDHITDHTERLETATLTTGKPYLVGRPEEISLSHSEAYVAAMIGQTDVGVDIQRCKEKILGLEHKFANPEESARIDRSRAMQYLHVLWSAKEALYKIYAQKRLNFRTHLFVDLPSRLVESGTFGGSIRVADTEIRCNLNYRMIDNYVLVYGHKIS